MLCAGGCIWQLPICVYNLQIVWLYLCQPLLPKPPKAGSELWVYSTRSRERTWYVMVDVITPWNLDCWFVWSFSILYVQRMATEAIEGMAPEEMSESAICGGSATTSHRCKPVPVMRVSTSTRHRDLEQSGSPGSPLRNQISYRRQLRKKEAEW